MLSQLGTFYLAPTSRFAWLRHRVLAPTSRFAWLRHRVLAPTSRFALWRFVVAAESWGWEERFLSEGWKGLLKTGRRELVPC